MPGFSFWASKGRWFARRSNQQHSRPCVAALKTAARRHLRASGAGFFKDYTMYAVIKTGGKQYRVVAGEKLKVEQIPADIGQEIVLDQVLMLGGESVVVGSPLVAGAKVLAKVISHGRGEKVRIFKMRRRKHYQKHQGHRQNYTEIEISAINA
jgi:large subunit ribosomal protein L21